MPVDNNDEQLVQAALSNDRQAFDQLVLRYQRQVVAVAARLLGNLHDGMEVAQDSFIRAYQSLDQLKQPSRFRPWLMRIATNQALNFRRKRSRQKAFSLDEQTNDDDGRKQLSRHLADSLPQAHEQLAADELKGLLEKAVDELPEKLRTALLLFSVEKLSQKEIADIMECSVQTVKWNVFEARRRLREQLKNYLQQG